LGSDCALSVLWDPAFLRYDFGSDHPFTERSRWLAVRLLDDSGFFGEPDATAPQWTSDVPRATREELGRFHTTEYLDVVERLGRSRTSHPLDAGDTPSFPGCYDAGAALCGGTLAGVRLARDSPKRHAFHPGGGLHHARPGQASGFCIFNDLAVAVRALQEESPSLHRVAYIDIDVHHGDGVMYGFYEDGGVLDIDFHQDGRTIFPGTGFLTETGLGDGAGLKVNVPLPPDVGDEAFIPLFEQIVPTMVRHYRPEMILLQCGFDAHVGDRLGNLQYTSAAYERAIELVHALAHELCGGRLVVTGGGGYSPENVSRGLARVALRLADRSPSRTLSQPLPAGWRQEFERDFHYPAPEGWKETITPDPSPWTPDRSAELLDTLAKRLGVYWDRSEVTKGSRPPGRG
jgi:acetoin utilization protein AcuC